MVANVVKPVATGGAKVASSAAKAVKNAATNALEPLKRPSQQMSMRAINTKRPPANDSSFKQTAAQTQALQNIQNVLEDDKPVEDNGESTELLASIDSKIGQQTVIESNDASRQIEALNELKDSQNVLSAKLGVLSERLNEKYIAANDAQTVPVETERTSSDALTELANKKAPTPEPDVTGALSPKEPKASNALLENGGKAGKELVSKANPVVGALTNVGGILKAGFKSSKNVLDQISGILFKASLARVAQFAKIAAMVFAIILAVDLVRAYWQIWGEKVMAKLDEWATYFKDIWTKFTAWADNFSDFRTLFENMSANFTEIKNAWVAGDFPALALALGGFVKDLGKTIIAAFTRAITSLTAELLGALGFKDAAKATEAFGLQQYQNLTSNRLSDENQRKLAEAQIKSEDKGGKTGTAQGLTSFIPNKWRNKIGILSDSEYALANAEEKDQSSMKSKDENTRVENRAAINEARESIERYKKQAEVSNANDAGQMAKVDKYRKESEQYLKNPFLNASPTVKAELMRQFSSVKVKGAASVKPAPSSESRDAQTVNAIKTHEAEKSRKTEAQNNVANVQNNIVKNNRSINVHAPVTSTNAPGVHKATGVN